MQQPSTPLARVHPLDSRPSNRAALGVEPPESRSLRFMGSRGTTGLLDGGGRRAAAGESRVASKSSETDA